MPKLSAGLEHNPRYTGWTEDQKYILKNIGEPGFYTRIMWSLNFGNGKSACMYAAILKLAQKYPGILIWLGRNHYSDLKRSNLRLFFEIVPKDIWGYKIYGGQNPTSIVFPNGSTVIFMGFGDPGGILGSAPGAVFIEEVSELDIDVYNILEGRVRQPTVPRHAQVIMGVGNPRGHYPLYKRFVQGEGMTPEAKKSYLWMKGDPFANAKNLPDNYYQDMLARFPKELQERFVLGSDDTHAGQVYPQFNREIHIEAFKWQSHWLPFIGMDYGKIDPTAVLFGGFDPYEGSVWIYGEHYRSHILVPRHVEILDEIVDTLKYPKNEAQKWADSNIADCDGGNGKSIQLWFAEGGWHFNLAAKKDALRPGIEKIQQLLTPNSAGQVKLHVHPRCTHTIEEFQMYEWKSPKGAVEMMHFKEEPREDHNHAMDALRYMVNAMPIAIQREGPRQVKSVWDQIEQAEDEGGGKAIIWNTQRVPQRPKRHPLADD